MGLLCFLLYDDFAIPFNILYQIFELFSQPLQQYSLLVRFLFLPVIKGFQDIPHTKIIYLTYWGQ